MPTTYTPNDTNNPATLTLPSDLDAQTAESVNAALRALGDKSAYALATRAAIGAINVFTRRQQIDPTNESEAVLSSTRYPGAIDADNRWALVFKFNIESNRTIRMYTGAVQGIGRLAWTQNAHWNADDQLWEQEDPDQTSAAVLWIAAATTFHYIPPGTTPFINWPTTPFSNGEGSVKTVGEFRYAQARTRTRTIPTAHCAGLYGIDGADGSVGTATIGDHSYIRWPIHLPPGAVLTKVSIAHNISSSAAETFEVTRRRTVWDSGSITIPPESVLATTASDSATGMHITAMTLSAVVDRFDELNLRWTPSGALSNNVHAITVEWTDQGPTPI